MATRRIEGEVHPGIHWGRFTTRIPGIHIGVSWPEVIQGGLITTATGGAVAALTMRFFQVPFEVAWTVVLIQLFWVWVVGTLLCGEPYAPGWITPALPVVMAFLGGFEPGVPAIHAMTAVTLCVAAIFLLFPITGLANLFFNRVPVELRAAIIFGSAIVAFETEFGRLPTMPHVLPVVWAVVLWLMFSVWFTKAKKDSRILNVIGSMAMLMGVFVAVIVGLWFKELSFNIRMGFHIPQIAEYLRAVSPFSIGWPAMDVYVKAFPLALMIYIFAFGDLVLANTLLEHASKARKDENFQIDNTKSHIVLFIRNIGHLLTGGPFIPLHGPIWTGVHVFLTERYKSGRRNMDSLFTGLFNWYWPAFILIFLVPVITFMKPLLAVALSITLILTGFACAYVAISLVKTPESRGYAFLVGMVIAKFGPALGLGLGIGLYLLLLLPGRGLRSQEVARTQ